jgi:arginine deiminase
LKSSQLKVKHLFKKVINYDLESGNDIQEYYQSDEYKRLCLSSMGVQDIIDLILIQPTVKLVPSTINTPVRVETINMSPLKNLTFNRDQQIVFNILNIRLQIKD